MHSKFLKISAAVFFAAALFSCSFDAPESDKGSISMRLPDKSQLGAACANGVSSSVSSDGSLSAGSVDQFKVVVRNISSRESITQFVAPGSSVTVDELEPGSWDVAIFGYANDPQGGSDQSIRYYGNARGIPVEGGETSNATVNLYDISGNMPGFGFNGVDSQAAQNIQYAYINYSCDDLSQSGDAFYSFNASDSSYDSAKPLQPPLPIFMEPGYAYKVTANFYDLSGKCLYKGTAQGIVPPTGGTIDGIQIPLAETFEIDTNGINGNMVLEQDSDDFYKQYITHSLNSNPISDLDNVKYRAVAKNCGMVPFVVTYGDYSCVFVRSVWHPVITPTINVPSFTVQKGQTITVSPSFNPSSPRTWQVFGESATATDGFKLYTVTGSDQDTWTHALSCNDTNANKVNFNDANKTLTGAAVGSNNFRWTVTVEPVYGGSGEPGTKNASTDFTATCVEAAQPSGGSSGNAAVNENFVQSQKKFTVAAGKQVYFSQGNLQYQASTDTWRFAEHQYDVVPEEDLAFTKVTSDYDEWIDVFGWGSSGYGRAKPYTRDYSVTDESGKSILTSLHVYGAIGVYIDYDWGVYNPIVNGGNKKGLWYTLTLNEWNYLFNTRTNANSLHVPARIKENASSENTIAGIVLLPDDWTPASVPDGVSFTTTASSSAYDTNILTYDQWEKLETTGAVFLPSLGYQGSDGSFYNRSNDAGTSIEFDYWSSSCPNSTYDTKYSIYSYYGTSFSSNSPSADNFMPVRLVKSAVDISPNIYISASAGSGGDGSAASPYASIADAIAQIKTNSSRTTDYTIYIDGALTGKQEIKDITPDCVKSITIKGKNGIDPATGEPRDSLTGDGAASSGPLLTIATNAVVKVEDLKITGGYAEQGGGVYVGNGSIACYVTLGSGALITGNKADTKGAGVYATDGDGTYLTIDGAVIKNNELVSDTAGSRLGSAVYSIGKQLVIKGDSLITNNLGSNEDNACPAVCVDWYQYRTSGYDISKFPESSIEGNAQIVNNTGVGVKAYVCNLSIKGNAKISGNTNAMSNSQGGGMIVEGYTRYYSSTYTAKVTISENAQISGNFADNGAGVFVKNSDTTLKIEGGSINGNKAQKLGGGVYCYGATIEISGGSIESNEVLADSTTTEGGGGVYLESWNNTSASTSNNAAIYLSGGTIKSNTCAGGLGTGIFANDFSTSSYNEYMVKIQDAGKVDLSNDIYLMRTTGLNPVIRIVNDLTETGTLAKVRLEKYENGNEVLGKGYYDPWTYINNHYSQFEIANSAWTLNSSGKLVSN